MSSDVAFLLRRYDPARLVADLEVLRDVERARQPGPYNDGTWAGVALVSRGGRDGASAGYTSTEPHLPTRHLEATPYFREVLDDIQCPKCTVRLLTLPPGGQIREHRDAGISLKCGLVRLHIPIVTHPDVVFLIGGERVRWEPGELWLGDFFLPHSVRNESPVTRVHMVIDVLVNDWLLSLLPRPWVERTPRVAVHRPPLPLPAGDAARFACTFTMPGEVRPLFQVHRPMREIFSEASAEIRNEDGKLVVLIAGEPSFVLERVAEDAFSVEGLPSSVRFQFALEGGRPKRLELVLQGLPRDLFSTFLGVLSGPVIDERRIPLPFR